MKTKRKADASLSVTLYFILSPESSAVIAVNMSVRQEVEPHSQDSCILYLWSLGFTENYPHGDLEWATQHLQFPLSTQTPNTHPSIRNKDYTLHMDLTHTVMCYRALTAKSLGLMTGFIVVMSLCYPCRLTALPFYEKKKERHRKLISLFLAVVPELTSVREFRHKYNAVHQRCFTG